jgi:hypothetical protein
VTGRHDIGLALRRIDGDGDRACAVVRRDAGGDAFFRFDRDRERRLVLRAVVARHHRQFQRLGTLLREREADKAAGVLGHEVDVFGRRHLRRNDDVAFVLAILGIDEDEHAPIAGVLDDFLGRGDEVVEFALGHANSLRRAR